MSKKIIVRGNSLRNIIIGVLLLLGFSFGSGYSLGTSSSLADEVVGASPKAEVVSDDIAWLLKLTPTQPVVVLPAESLPEVVATSPAPPPLVPSVAPVAVSEPPAKEAEPAQPVSDADRLQVCLKLACEVHGEDWEKIGFKPGTVNKLTEKLASTSSIRAECESVLSEAAPFKRAARKKLECIRTRHREAQCAVLHWNKQEALPKDSKGNLIMRSAVALNLLLDFHLNGVKNPNHISLCVGDIHQQYAQFVVAEASTYQVAYNSASVRRKEVDAIFCAEQRAEITTLPQLGEFARGQRLAGFQFPPFPALAMVPEVMNAVCPSQDGAPITSASAK